MIQTKVYLGQVLDLGLDTELADMSQAASPVIRAWPPQGAYRDWSATVSGTKLRYTTVKDTDLNMVGEWRVQAVPNIVGAEAPGETFKFTVHAWGR
jgi:hypothetical protein